MLAQFVMSLSINARIGPKRSNHLYASQCSPDLRIKDFIKYKLTLSERA